MAASFGVWVGGLTLDCKEVLVRAPDWLELAPLTEDSLSLQWAAGASGWSVSQPSLQGSLLMCVGSRKSDSWEELVGCRDGIVRKVTAALWMMVDRGFC